jgi:hypothetical protein
MDYIIRLNEQVLHSEWHRYATNDDAIEVLGTEDVLGYIRRCGSSRHGILVIANFSAEQRQTKLTCRSGLESVGVHEAITWNAQDGELTWMAESYDSLVVAVLFKSA